MRLLKGRLWSVVLTGLLLTGCGGGAGRDAQTPDGGAAVHTPDDVFGNWMLILSENHSDHEFGIVELKKDAGRNPEGRNPEGSDRSASARMPVRPEASPLPVPVGAEGVEAKLLSTAVNFGGQKLTGSKVDGRKVQLNFEGTGRSFVFRGERRGDVIWGTLSVPKLVVIPACLVLTEETRMRNSEPRETPGSAELMTALQSDDPVPLLHKLVEKFSTSPIALEAYTILCGMAKREKLSEKDVGDLVEKFRATARRWGDLFETKANLDAGYALAVQNYAPKLTPKILAQAESKLTEDSPADWHKVLGSAYVNAGDVDKGISILRPLHKQDRYDAMVAYSLAKAQEPQDPEAALELYAFLAALPGLESSLRNAIPGGESELPGEKVAKLWKQKHKSTKGLDAYLAEIYESELRRIPQPREDAPAATPDARVALFELFTGSACPPCVAADLAAGALTETFAPAELIVIKFHQHMPAPDPLANTTTEERGRYYGIEGTPSAALNGKGLERLPNGAGVGGFLQHVEPVYAGLRELITKSVQEKTPARIELTAQAVQGQLQVNASVSGLEEISSQMRLRLAILENDVQFVAPNGIRHHEGVVRAMPGGSKGIRPANGKLSFNDSVPLAALKSHLKKGMLAAEQEYGVEFPVQPLALKKLSVVAFVQNDKTREILQAVMVPVTGDLDVSGEPADSTATGN